MFRGYFEVKSYLLTLGCIGFFALSGCSKTVERYDDQLESNFGNASTSGGIGEIQAQLSQLAAHVDALTLKGAEQQALIDQLVLMRAQDLSRLTDTENTVEKLKEAQSVLEKKLSALESKLRTEPVRIVEQSTAVSQTQVTALRPDDFEFSRRLAALEEKTQSMRHTQIEGRPSVIFEKVNLYVRNGEGKTFEKNGLGNLIIGYNERARAYSTPRDGSHNIVIGVAHTYSDVGELKVGREIDSEARESQTGRVN
jgi:hypothetical protein